MRRENSSGICICKRIQHDSETSLSIILDLVVAIIFEKSRDINRINTRFFSTRTYIPSIAS